MSAMVNARSAPLRADALSGVRRRRVLAFCVDITLVALLTAILWTVLLVLTLGLSALLLPPLLPIVAFFYNGLTVSGPGMGTPGMRAFDIEMRMAETGARVPFINAAAQALFFYLSWCFPLAFVVTLFDAEKRFLHDLLAQVVVVRRL